MEDENKLIRRVKLGSRKGADTLVRMYYDEIFVYAYRQTSDREAAMDITQEIFIAALRAIHKFDEQKASFRTWLYKIATNKIIDFIRNRKTGPLQCDIYEIEAAEDVNFEEFIENEEFSSRLVNYISEFNAENQRIFRLKFFEEYTFSQISEIMNLPESTVKTRYYRLLKKIKTEFFSKGKL